MGDQPPTCRCGTLAIGVCANCGVAVCGNTDCSERLVGRLLCAADAQAWHREEHARAVEAAARYKRDLAAWEQRRRAEVGEPGPRGFAPFEPAWERLKPCLEEVVEALKSRYPGIWAEVRYHTPTEGPQRFSGGANFMYDPASQRWEDLVIVFWVGAAYFSPETRALGNNFRDAVEFYIERGTGQRLWALRPKLLPGGDQSAERRQILVDYADAATRFVEERRAAILEILSKPFVP